jgi:hypothetical protein
MSVSDKELIAIQDVTTAKEAWDRIKQAHKTPELLALFSLKDYPSRSKRSEDSLDSRRRVSAQATLRDRRILIGLVLTMTSCQTSSDTAVQTEGARRLGS